MSKEVCTCLGLTDDDIIKAVKDGAKTVDAIEEATGAGSVCGACKDEIQEIIDANK
ncbi:MAG: (2Fe-2S)-binding protein [Clostridium perfringens]|nr:(2Fe-2S)-binding protein [Clostridium perfringens]